MKLEFLNKQPITEGLADEAARAEQDHEVQMARADCFYAAKDAIELHKLLSGISEQQGLDGWVSAKITLAADYLKSVKEHLEYKSMSQQVASDETNEFDQLSLDADVMAETSTTSGAVATSMGGGNGFVNGGPGSKKMLKRKMSEAIPTGTVGTSGTQATGDEEVADALKKAGNTALANKLKTGSNFNKDEMAAIIAAKG